MENSWFWTKNIYQWIDIQSKAPPKHTVIQDMFQIYIYTYLKFCLFINLTALRVCFHNSVELCKRLLRQPPKSNHGMSISGAAPRSEYAYPAFNRLGHPIFLQSALLGSKITCGNQTSSSPQPQQSETHLWFPHNVQGMSWNPNLIASSLVSLGDHYFLDEHNTQNRLFFPARVKHIYEHFNISTKLRKRKDTDKIVVSQNDHGSWRDKTSHQLFHLTALWNVRRENTSVPTQRQIF